jgi:hypothetical protein
MGLGRFLSVKITTATASTRSTRHQLSPDCAAASPPTDRSHSASLRARLVDTSLAVARLTPLTLSQDFPESHAYTRGDSPLMYQTIDSQLCLYTV